MWFNSFTFLWFFAIVFPVYLLLPTWRSKKVFILAASYFFYASWNPPFLLLLLLTSFNDLYLARAISRSDAPRTRRLLLAISCVVNFGVLAFFKYSHLLLDTFVALLQKGGFAASFQTPEWMTQIVLPIGISFYTFHGVSYVFDVYRRKIGPTDSPLDFLIYVAFFPQLVAGPILRAGQFLPQLEEPRSIRSLDVGIGGYLVVLGLFQKLVLADNIAPIANAVFDEPARFSTAELWLGTYAFAFQIYFDFAGYSNIAIGTARLLGFTIPENFRVPYIACGFREFWRRWHISLSTWLRDYLYIALGGNRGTTARTIRNLMIVMVLGGLWHGANWTFAVWGALHGAYLAAEHLLTPYVERWKPRTRTLLRPLGVLLTFHLTCIAWVFFRMPRFDSALTMLRGMLFPDSFAVDALGAGELLYIVAALASTLIALLLHRRKDDTAVPPWAWGASAALMLFFIVTAWADASQFIYFQF